jgi:hypothetical protein
MAIPTMTNNSPSAGSIAWGAFTIQLNGVAYSVNAGSTSERWVWWQYNGGSPSINAGAEIPSTLVDDDLLLFANKNGIGARVQSSNFVDGELLVDGSIFADALSTNLINSNHIVTVGLDAAVIKFGVMLGDRIAARTITADKLFVGSLDNLVSDGNFVDTTFKLWVLGGATVATVTVNTTEPNYMTITNLAAAATAFARNVSDIEVAAGDEYFVDGEVFGLATNNRGTSVNFHMAVTLDNGTVAYPGVTLTRTQVNGAWTPLKGKITMPAGARTASPRIAVISGAGDTAGDQYRFRNFYLRRLLQGELIVDGTIRTAHMTVDSIEGDRIKINTLNATKIIAGTISTDRMTANTISGDRITAGTLNADKIIAGTITTDRMTANTISGDRITAGTLNADKIVAGTITTTQMTANTINGDRITANTLNAAKIVAGSITATQIAAYAISASKIAIASYENVVTDGQFLYGNTVWTALSTGMSIVTSTTEPNHAALTTTAASASHTYADVGTAFAVSNGDQFYATAEVYVDAANTVGNDILLAIGVRNNAGAYSTFPQATIAAATALAGKGTWLTLAGNLTISDVNARTAVPLFGVNSNATGGQKYKFRNLKIRRKNAGTLIVDGSIVTNHLTANTINGDRITANTLNASKIVAGSIATDRMTANTISGTVITATTLNADKIVAGSITTTQMTANTISGDRITAGTLNADKIVAGTITTTQMTANTINGDRITAGTLHADKITAGTIVADKINGTTFTGKVLQGAVIEGGRLTVGSAGGPQLDMTTAVNPYQSNSNWAMMAIKMGVAGWSDGLVWGNYQATDSGFANQQTGSAQFSSPYLAGVGTSGAARLQLIGVQDGTTWANLVADTLNIMADTTYLTSTAGAFDFRIGASSPSNKITIGNYDLSYQIQFDFSTLGVRRLAAKDGSARARFDLQASDLFVDVSGNGGDHIQFYGNSNTRPALGCATPNSSIQFDSNGVVSIRSWNGLAYQVLRASTLRADSGGVFDESYSGGGTNAASINNSGRLIRTSSSGRYKHSVEPLSLDEAYSALNLEPVTFVWNEDREMGDRRVPGFIAEQADLVGASLWVTYTEDDEVTGMPEGFRYAELTAAHNLILKDHEKELVELRELVRQLMDEVQTLKG